MRAVLVYRGPSGPSVRGGNPVHLPVATNTFASPLVGVSVNARIHPLGLAATWFVEYGADDSYGTTTTPRALPGKLTAIWREDWTDGLNGWIGGRSGTRLEHEVSDGGFVRLDGIREDGTDSNHIDGVGLIKLGPYAHFRARQEAGFPPTLVLGGGKPDFRDARISLRIRGSMQILGSTICPWVQSDLDPTVLDPTGADILRPNWACISQSINRYVVDGEWHDVTLTLRNNVSGWVYASHNPDDGRPDYRYGELDACLSHVNYDLFLAQMLHAASETPRGHMDFDGLVFRYRNHNMCAVPNGGTLVSSPTGTDAAVLTDGDRCGGPSHTWQGALGAFVYTFADPVTVDSVTIHNDPLNPSEDVQVETSTNGVSWTDHGTKTLLDTSADGDNFLFKHWDDDDGTNYVPLGASVTHLRVTIVSKYGATAGLGSIEAHGSGNVELTENAWYNVNQDIELASGTYHYRVGVTTNLGTVYGDDQTVVVP